MTKPKDLESYDSRSILYIYIYIIYKYIYYIIYIMMSMLSMAILSSMGRRTAAAIAWMMSACSLSALRRSVYPGYLVFSYCVI